ncbi:DYW_deaminase domain-containing protein [Psidium guajava]|nr:DYW_deaminase domain-containing protein [Psidium guajava]
MVLLRIAGGEITPQIEVTRFDTILNLKETIRDALGVEVGRQTLVYDERALLDDVEIRHCIFGREPATVTLHVAPLPEGTKIAVRLESSLKQESMRRIQETDSVAGLRSKIERRWGLRSCSIALFPLDTQMSEDLPLSAYYVVDGAEIDVQVTLIEEGR